MTTRRWPTVRTTWPRDGSCCRWVSQKTGKSLEWHELICYGYRLMATDTKDTTLTGQAFDEFLEGQLAGQAQR